VLRWRAEDFDLIPKTFLIPPVHLVNFRLIETTETQQPTPKTERDKEAGRLSIGLLLVFGDIFHRLLIQMIIM